MVRLGDYISLKTGKLDVNASSEDGRYPFFTCATKIYRIDNWAYDCECVLIAGNGDLNVKYYEGKFNAYQRTYILESKDKEKLDVRYLFHFMNKYIETLREGSIGGVIKYIKKGDIEEADIPLISIEEQRRMAFILDKVDDIKKSSVEIQDSRLRIIQSAFIEMFGDPIINPHNYPIIRFGELGTLDRGKSKHRPRNDPRLLGGNHPLIQTGEIRSAHLFVNTFTSTYSDFGLAQSRKWPAGTLAITIAANIAESAILGIEACFPDSIVGFTPNSNTNSIFIKAQLDFLKDRISEVAPQSAQKNINLKILREIPMVCPPVEMQEQFCDFVRNATQIFDSVNKGIDLAEELAKSSVQSLIN